MDWPDMKLACRSQPQGTRRQLPDRSKTEHASGRSSRSAEAATTTVFSHRCPLRTTSAATVPGRFWGRQRARSTEFQMPLWSVQRRIWQSRLLCAKTTKPLRLRRTRAPNANPAVASGRSRRASRIWRAQQQQKERPIGFIACSWSTVSRTCHDQHSFCRADRPHPPSAAPRQKNLED